MSTSKTTDAVDYLLKNEPTKLAAIFERALRRGWQKWDKAIAQRDEARRWARYYKAQCERLEAHIVRDIARKIRNLGL